MDGWREDLLSTCLLAKPHPPCTPTSEAIHRTSRSISLVCRHRAVCTGDRCSLIPWQRRWEEGGMEVTGGKGKGRSENGVAIIVYLPQLAPWLVSLMEAWTQQRVCKIESYKVHQKCQSNFPSPPPPNHTPINTHW